MNVYAETNFLLALSQPEAAACEELVVLAEQGRIRLALPAFCFLEASTTGRKRRLEIGEFARQLDRPTELNRLPWLDTAVEDFRKNVISSAADIAERLERLTERLLKCADVLVLDGQSIVESAALPDSYGLTPPDRMVLVTVVAAMKRSGAESIFLNRNTKDFDSDKVKLLLSSVQSRLISSFVGGLDTVRTKVPKA